MSQQLLPMNEINAVVNVPLRLFPGHMEDLESLNRVSRSDFSTVHDADWCLDEMIPCAEGDKCDVDVKPQPSSSSSSGQSVVLPC